MIGIRFAFSKCNFFTRKTYEKLGSLNGYSVYKYEITQFSKD